MNICGVLVFANPAKMDDVVSSLSALEGVEVHMSVREDGRVVATVEDTANAPAIESLTAIHKLDGVVSASIVYHNFETAQKAAVHN